MLYEEDDVEIGIDIERPKNRPKNNKVTFDIYGRPNVLDDQDYPWMK